MTSVGPNGTGTGADDASSGTQAWSNPGNITTADTNYATCAPSGGSATTHILKATNFGFAITSTATILGIVDEIHHKSTGTNAAKDASIKQIVSGSITGNDKADTVNFWPTIVAYATYGASNDAWGLTLTGADVNASTSGLAIQATVSGSFQGGQIDYVRRTVYYSTTTTSVRTVSSTAIFKATNTRTISGTTGFKSTRSRLIHNTTGFKSTLARLVHSTSLFRSLRTISSTTLFSGSPHRRVASSTLFAYDLSSPLLAPTVTDGATSASGMAASAAALASDDATDASLSGAVHAVMIGSGGTKARFS